MVLEKTKTNPRGSYVTDKWGEGTQVRPDARTRKTKIIAISLPQEDIEILDRLSAARQINNRSFMIREALREYIERHEQEVG